MEKLNELVELAKKATGGEWNAFIATGGDGTFSIHTPQDSRKGDIVNWPGFDTAGCSKTQKKANVKYIAAANPATILAIAEAFRALEQERDELRQHAEAAEADNRNYSELLSYHIDRQAKAEAKLAELDKQLPVAEVVSTLRGLQRVKDVRWREGNSQPLGTQLFTRPAPAANLAELVPAERNKWESTDEESYDIDYMEPSDIYQMGKDEGFNLCRVAILRNIEESK